MSTDKPAQLTHRVALCPGELRKACLQGREVSKELCERLLALRTYALVERTEFVQSQMARELSRLQIAEKSDENRKLFITEIN